MGFQDGSGRTVKVLKRCITLHKTNQSPLKMDGWETTFLLGEASSLPVFRGQAVGFREGRCTAHCAELC